MHWACASTQPSSIRASVRSLEKVVSPSGRCSAWQWARSCTAVGRLLPTGVSVNREAQQYKIVRIAFVLLRAYGGEDASTDGDCACTHEDFQGAAGTVAHHLMLLARALTLCNHGTPWMKLCNHRVE